MNTNNSDETAALLFNLGVKEEKLFVADARPEAEEVPDEFKMFTVENFDQATTLTATFYFSRITSESLSYQLLKYDAQLTWKNKSLLPRRQTFYLVQGVLVPLREAFNLLQGRSVYKELSSFSGEKYQAWMRLNLEKKDIHGNFEIEYNRSFQAFDLGRALANYPVQALQAEEMALRLIHSLLAGNIELVNFIRGKKIEKVYIEANPQMEDITINPAIRPMKKREKR